MLSFEEFSREDLVKLIEMHAKNWLAHDGCWFLASEEKYGMEVAIELDKRSWEKFTVAEAKRIMETFDIKVGGGLEALAEALKYRLYATVNKQESELVLPNKLIFTMINCRVQAARRRKNLPDFPCKSVGIVEYSGFASTIDPRIKTKCIYCPPDKHNQPLHCQWEFTLEEGL
jgi:hypothetical protein